MRKEEDDDNVGMKVHHYYDADDAGINIPFEEYQRRCFAMIDASRWKRRRAHHYPEDGVGEVGEEERHRCDDDAESFADDNTRLAAAGGGDSNNATITVLDRKNVGSEDCPRRDDEKGETTNGIIDSLDSTEFTTSNIDASPNVIKAAQASHRAYKRLPMEHVQLIAGAVLCFFGGFYPTLFAALQASIVLPILL